METAFSHFFSQTFGEGRWPALFKSLSATDEKIARVNPFTSATFESAKTLLGETYIDEVSARGLRLANENQAFYFMDLASLLPPIALELKPGDVSLDLCAAPGGKSLVMASRLGTELEFTVNELSLERRSRLIRVLKEQLPEDIFRQIKITSHDAGRWSQFHPATYDKILLDAPCSGERYFISDAQRVAEWTPKRSQSMAIRQFTLMASAFDSLKVGGDCVYSTCSISPFENDDVIKKLLKKRKDQVEVLDFTSPIGERTEFGWQILPDQCDGFGPIYFAKVRSV